MRGGYGLYFNTNNHQNLIVTVTNPPATPRPVIANPTFPNPPFDRAGAISIRPVQFDLENPRVHVYNVNVQRELGADRGHRRLRRIARRHLLRSGDVNTRAADGTTADGTSLHPRRHAAANTAFSTIELKSSDGDSWYDALIFDVRRRWSRGPRLQSSYTLSKSEDTTQASTFFSDATNGTTSALPEFVPDYNKGPSDFDTPPQLGDELHVGAAVRAQGRRGRRVLGGWQLSGIWTMRSGNPLTVFVTTNRSRSQWKPSRGPGIGQDRPSYAPGRRPDNAVIGRPEQWFDPDAFVLQPAGTFGNTGRGDFTGPNLRTLDCRSASRRWAPRRPRRAPARGVQRAEPHELRPAGAARVRRHRGPSRCCHLRPHHNTVTSSRQIQVGVRVVILIAGRGMRARVRGTPITGLSTSRGFRLQAEEFGHRGCMMTLAAFVAGACCRGASTVRCCTRGR